MNRQHLIFLTLSVVLSFSPHCLGVETESEKISLLLERAPQRANTVGYVNLASLTKLMSDAGFTTPGSGNVLDYWFISDFDLGRMTPRWEAGYATLKKSIDAASFAEQVQGYVDTISGTKAVWSPRETYFVPSDDAKLGVLRPANRSMLSSWIQPGLKVNSSDFLESQCRQPENYLSLMFAVDLSDVFSPVSIEKKIAGLKSLKQVPASTAASTLASIQGVSLIVGRNSLSECIVTLQFSKSPASLQLIAPALFAELLSRNGSAAPEVATWKASVGEGNLLKLQGPITEATLSGVIGLFSLQDQAERSASAVALANSAEQQTAYLSKQYFDDIVQIIERTRSHKSYTSGELAKWNDQRARQIDEMGTLNVDPEVIEFGVNVANLLRGNALTVRQGNIDAGKIKASQSLSYGYYGDGYVDFNSTTDYQAVTSAYARGNAYANYHDILNQIDRLVAETRREMTNKFKIQF